MKYVNSGKMVISTVGGIEKHLAPGKSTGNFDCKQHLESLAR